MLTDEQRDEFDRFGIVRMPGAIVKSAADEMLGVVWGCLRDCIISIAGRRRPGRSLRVGTMELCSRLAGRIGFWGRIICPSR